MATHEHEPNPKRSVGAGANDRSPSTRWEWRRVKMSRPPEARGAAAPQGRPFQALPPWDRRRPLSIKVKYRGGAEGWVEIHARGSILRRPGHVALLDVLTEIWR